MFHLSLRSNIRVTLSGGRQHFRTKDQTDPEYSSSKGERMDGRDLTQVIEYLGKGC